MSYKIFCDWTTLPKECHRAPNGKEKNIAGQGDKVVATFNIIKWTPLSLL